ncbi:MAG TPA: diguanylate cyclase [Acidimicrobiia bacterium]
MTSASEAELRPALPARAGGRDGTDAGAATLPSPDSVPPLDDFELAAEAVLAHLAAALPLRDWVVARVDGDEGVVLASTGSGRDVARGTTFRFSGSLSARLLADGPRAVHDLHGLDIDTTGDTTVGAYLGVPLCRSDGTRFGVLAGFGPEPLGAELVDGLPLAELLARLLAGLLAVVVRAEAEARRHDRADASEMHDGVTGLGDRRYFEQVLAAEESRCRRYGDRAAVVAIELEEHDYIAAAAGPAAVQVLLRRAARVLRTESRDEDLVARVAPGTFAVLSIGADAEGAEAFAARLEEALVQNEVAAAIRVRARDPREGLHAAWAAVAPDSEPLDERGPA